MFKKVVLSLVVAVLIFGGTAFAQQGGNNIVNGMLPWTSVDPTTAVYVNPGGLGDTLIYPYYNVRGQSTFFNVVNTDETNKVVARVRFREAKASREVLDFNLCLSPGDVWTAVITDDGTRGKLTVMERHLPFSKTNPVIPAEGVTFKDAGNGGIAGVTADDTREGYFEIIGLVRTPEVMALSPQSECPVDTLSEGPANDVLNSLFGAVYMVNPSTGETFGYSATAVGNFHNIGISSAGLGTENITLASGSTQLADLNVALTKANLYGFYALDASIAGEAAYVISFPTKRASEILDPLQLGVFDRDADTNCPTPIPGESLGYRNVRIGLSLFDDAEHKTAEAPQFSPITTAVNDLCYEVNVIELGNSNILNSNVEIDISAGAFERGWIDVSLVQELNHVSVSDDLFLTSFGVPAIGLQLHSFGGGSHSGMLPMTYKTVVLEDVAPL